MTAAATLILRQWFSCLRVCPVAAADVLADGRPVALLLTGFGRGDQVSRLINRCLDPLADPTAAPLAPWLDLCTAGAADFRFTALGRLRGLMWERKARHLGKRAADAECRSDKQAISARQTRKIR